MSFFMSVGRHEAYERHGAKYPITPSGIADAWLSGPILEEQSAPVDDICVPAATGESHRCCARHVNRVPEHYNQRGAARKRRTVRCIAIPKTSTFGSRVRRY